jgi:hypothetical protein
MNHNLNNDNKKKNKCFFILFYDLVLCKKKIFLYFNSYLFLVEIQNNFFFFQLFSIKSENRIRLPSSSFFLSSIY